MYLRFEAMSGLDNESLGLAYFTLRFGYLVSVFWHFTKLCDTRINPLISTSFNAKRLLFLYVDTCQQNEEAPVLRRLLFGNWVTLVSWSIEGSRLPA